MYTLIPSERQPPPKEYPIDVFGETLICMFLSGVTIMFDQCQDSCKITSGIAAGVDILWIALFIQGHDLAKRNRPGHKKYQYLISIIKHIMVLSDVWLVYLMSQTSVWLPGMILILDVFGVVMLYVSVVCNPSTPVIVPSAPEPL
jgi:hypothetical protein